MTLIHLSCSDYHAKNENYVLTNEKTDIELDLNLSKLKFASITKAGNSYV